MGSSIPAGPSVDNNESPPPRIQRIKKKRRLEPGVRYALIAAAIVAVAVLIQFGVHMARSDPRDTRTIAERELQLNALRPGEQVVRQVSVFKRPAISYF